MIEIIAYTFVQGDTGTAQYIFDSFVLRVIRFPGVARDKSRNRAVHGSMIPANARIKSDQESGTHPTATGLCLVGGRIAFLSVVNDGLPVSQWAAAWG